MNPKKILLIDNSDIDNYINITLLRSSNITEEIISFQSAREGLKYLESVAATPDAIPELILLDLGMQIMDGFGFLEEFVKLPPAVSAFTRIIVLTSSIDPKDRQRSKVYNCVIDLMEKPLKLEMLKRLINE